MTKNKTFDNEDFSPDDISDSARIILEASTNYDLIGLLRGVSHIFYRLSMYSIVMMIAILVIGSIEFTGPRIFPEFLFFRSLSNQNFTIVLIAAVLYMDILRKFSTLINDDAHVMRWKKAMTPGSEAYNRSRRYSTIAGISWILYIVFIILVFPETYSLTTEEFPDSLRWIFYSLIHFMIAAFFLAYGLATRNNPVVVTGIIQFVGQMFYLINIEPWVVALSVFAFSFYVGSVLFDRRIGKMQIDSSEEDS